MNKLSIHEGRNASSSRLPAGKHRASGQSRSASQPRTVGRTRPAGHLRRAGVAAETEEGIRVSIHSNADILEARKRGRALAAKLGFPSIDCTLIASTISELARNIVNYASHGEIRLRKDQRLGSAAIVITAMDHGPGIRDVRTALQDGYSTSHGLGLGLPGVKRIMDEFDIVSTPKQGTTVTVKKWTSQ